LDDGIGDACDVAQDVAECGLDEGISVEGEVGISVEEVS
jgi:hypothetical protein